MYLRDMYVRYMSVKCIHDTREPTVWGQVLTWIHLCKKLSQSLSLVQNYVNISDDPSCSLNVYMLDYYVCTGLC